MVGIRLTVNRTIAFTAGSGPKPVDNHPRRAGSGHTDRMRHDGRGERGQALSSFVVVTVIALLLIAGLVVDGGRKTAADRRAELTAAAAARAAVDATAAQRQAGHRPDAGTALAAAHEMIAAEPRMQGSVSVAADGTVRVSTTTSVDTVLLSLIGVTQLSGSGSAAAQLYD